MFSVYYLNVIVPALPRVRMSADCIDGAIAMMFHDDAATKPMHN